MAIVVNGTKNSLTANELPSGYVRPTVAEVSDFHYKRTIVLSVLKATVETASGASTMEAIINNATIGITKQIADILALDYLSTAAVTAYADLVGLTHNLSGVYGGADYLKNIAVSYICTVDVYVKSV